MYGAIEVGGVRYCLVPNDRSTLRDEPYFAGSPSARAAAVDVHGRLIDDTGYPIPQTRAIREEEIWCGPQDSLLVSIGEEAKRWPLFPVKPSLLDFPPELVDSVLGQLRLEWQPTRPDAEAVLWWGGIALRRRFQLAVIPVGVAVWPPKPLPGWQPYFLLFARGRRENPTSARQQASRPSALFAKYRPVVFSRGAASPGSWTGGEVKLCGRDEIAIARTRGVPGWFGLTAPGSREPLGLHLIASLQDDVFCPSEGETWANQLNRLSMSLPDSSEAALTLAIDFGTSNTAVATRAEGGKPALLRFSPEARAQNLTRAIGLNPYSGSDVDLRFFRGDTDEEDKERERWYSNPLPTVLFEFRERDLEPFEGWQALPARSIPIGEIAPVYAAEWTRANKLRQDFKWDQTSHGRVLREAFLEQLALLVAYELRRSAPDEVPRRLVLVPTRPLAFSNQQTETLGQAFQAVERVLKECGFQGVSQLRFLSESYANFECIRQNPAGLTQARDAATERIVVIDIGGGTTDISIFPPRGEPCFLDSLYLGGKDLAMSLLPFRILEQDRWSQVAQALKVETVGEPESRRDEKWCEAIQYILIHKMKGRSPAEEDGKRENLAKAFVNTGMRDMLGELLALFMFATTYAVRMALQPDPEKISYLRICYVGLGSRLLDLCPLAMGETNRWETAKRVARYAIEGVPEAKGKIVDIERLRLTKETVCLGAAAANIDSREGEGAPEKTRGERRPELCTLWWANIARDSAPIKWNHTFAETLVASFTAAEITQLDTTELVDCFRAATLSAGLATFERNWKPDASLMMEVELALAAAYARGCSAISGDSSTEGLHPVRYVTESLKEGVCRVFEP